jgi:hypothetical protein
MVASIRIDDGNPPWLSPFLIPSRDLMVSAAASPTMAAVSTNSMDVFVYVKVENTGTQDLGNCACTRTGAWIGATVFGHAYGGVNPSTDINPRGIGTLRMNPMTGDVLDLGGGVTSPLGPATRVRVWDWSPDGKFLGYAAQGSQTGMNGATDWTLSVLALQSFTRPDGSVVQAGHVVVSETSGVPWKWTVANFFWVGSSAVLASGPDDPIKPPLSAAVPPLEWRLLCIAAPAAANVWRRIPPPAVSGVNGAIDRWLYLPSPCETVIAFTPNLSAQRQENIIVVALATATTATFKRNNVPVAVTCVATQPKINTAAHTANGVTIDIGNGQLASNVKVDDPDCTAVPDAIQVIVDRVKASTLPSANLGVLHVGDSSAGPLAQGTSKWVQVVNVNGWANQGEQHWCLLAQGCTQDGVTIPRPWNGQAAAPPAFPLSLDNCAQHNIMIG